MTALMAGGMRAPGPYSKSCLAAVERLNALSRSASRQRVPDRQLRLAQRTGEWNEDVSSTWPQVHSLAMSVNNSAVEQAANRLLTAREFDEACPPVRDLIGSNDLVAAYAVQKQLTEHRLAAGGRIVGHKIGLTSEAVQRQLGVDKPDFGVLFHDMEYVAGGVIPFRAVMQARVEAEVAFVLKEDLAEGALDATRLRSAVAYATPALEICGSRIADWDISFGDTVADNASAGAYVLGPVHTPMEGFEPREVEMSMSMNGQVVSTGVGAACLGDPLYALEWLARQARALGEPLRSGHVVLTGALGPMQPVIPGATVTASISGLGRVSVRFGNDDDHEGMGA